jgi:Leucine-rich repeat (LRR) protein
MFTRKLLSLWIGIIFLSGISLMGCGSGDDGGNVPATCEGASVNFPDWALRQRMWSAFGKLGPICASDLEGLTFLSATGHNISDLAGLEYCTALYELYLSDNQISDLSPLAGLTGLWILYLNDNQISDIAPLVANVGFGSGDEVLLESNPLSDESCNVYIPELETRGVSVKHDCP